MPAVAYSPYDPAQRRLLGALALSEVGRASDPYDLGTGGFDLSNADRDEYGFPRWGGITTSAGPSHAAGAYQFQPGTWATLAQRYGLDFRRPQDQNAAAWYHAQDTYRAETGGDLSAALAAGDYSSIESALGRTQWVGARGKLAGYLGGDKSANLSSDQDELSEALERNAREGGDFGRWVKERYGIDLGQSAGEAAGGVLTRVLMFVVGAILLLAAVWWLLSSAGVAPGPGTVAKLAKAAT